MSEFSLMYPMFAMVSLTFGVLLTMLRTRLRLVAEQRLKTSHFEVYQGDEPEPSLRLSRHFTNLLESPTLFYAACLAAMVTQQATLVVQSLAWVYVRSYLHPPRAQLRSKTGPLRTSWVGSYWLGCGGIWLWGLLRAKASVRIGCLASSRLHRVA